MINALSEHYGHILESFGFTRYSDNDQGVCAVMRVKHTTITIVNTHFGCWISPSIVEGNIRIPCESGSWSFAGIAFSNAGSTGTRDSNGKPKNASRHRCSTVQTESNQNGTYTSVIGDTGWQDGNGNHPGPNWGALFNYGGYTALTGEYEDVVPPTIQELGSLTENSLEQVIDMLKRACREVAEGGPTTISYPSAFFNDGKFEYTSTPAVYNTTKMEFVSINHVANLPCSRCNYLSDSFNSTPSPKRTKLSGAWDYFNLMGLIDRDDGNVSYTYGYNGTHPSPDNFGDPNAFESISKELGMNLAQLLGGLRSVEVPTAVDALHNTLTNLINDGTAADAVGDAIWDLAVGQLPSSVVNSCKTLFTMINNAYENEVPIGDIVRDLNRMKEVAQTNTGHHFLNMLGISQNVIDSLQEEGFTFENLLNAQPMPTKGLCEVVNAVSNLLDKSSDFKQFGDSLKKAMKEYFNGLYITGSDTPLEDVIFNKDAISQAAEDQRNGRYPGSFRDGGGDYLLGISNTINTA